MAKRLISVSLSRIHRFLSTLICILHPTMSPFVLVSPLWNATAFPLSKLYILFSVGQLENCSV